MDQRVIDIINADTDECIGWTGSLLNGYPRIKIDGRTEYVSALVMEATGRPRPSRGMKVIPTCRTKGCLNHRHLTWGNPQHNRTQTAELLWSLAAIETDACSVWPFAIDTRGYPSLVIDGVHRTGHRAVCERYHGTAPGMQTRHLCGEKRCVNPRHLQWGTRSQNMLDKRLHGTYGVKLTEEQVNEIRAMLGEVPQREIAARFSVAPSTIYDIAAGRTWRPVT